MIKGSKWSAETRAKMQAIHSPKGACKRGHLRTPENTDAWNSCRLCKAAGSHQWRKKHPAYILETNRRKSERIKRRMDEYKETHPCVDCGETDPVVLIFDHRDPKTKKGRMRQMRSWAQLEAEIAKCDVRCCNCHARRHAKDFERWGKR